jgi:hypothetical protein
MNQTLVNEALQGLKEYGAKIKPYRKKYIVEDNGIWGFVNEEGPMVLDGDDIVELAEQYTDFQVNN